MFPEIKYIVNEEKRTVVAVAIGCERDALDEILKSDYTAKVLLAINFGDMNNVPIIDKELILPDKFIGVAHCHPEDEFDFEVGKKIATRKLHKSYNKAKRNVVKNFANRVNRLSENLDITLNKINKRIAQ